MGLLGQVSLNALLQASSPKHPTLQQVTSSEETAKDHQHWMKLTINE